MQYNKIIRIYLNKGKKLVSFLDSADPRCVALVYCIVIIIIVINVIFTFQTERQTRNKFHCGRGSIRVQKFIHNHAFLHRDRDRSLDLLTCTLISRLASFRWFRTRAERNIIKIRVR